MRNVIFIVAVSAVYAACTGTTTASNESSAGSNASTSTAVSLPYTAAYSSDFSKGSDSNTLSVLNNYKAWETGDMNAFKNTIGDSLTIDFSTGGQYSGPRDSIVYYASKFRDSLSKVELRMDAFTSLHSNDKNEDWVLVWYKEIDTHKTGKIDSTYYEDDNMVNKDGKIVYVDSHKRVLK